MKFEPYNKCIYCGETEKKLTDEHIVPQSLSPAWQILLPKSSCEVCQRVINVFEHRVGRHMYLPYRIKHQMSSKKPKNRPKEFVMKGVKDNGDRVDVVVPAEEYPCNYMVLVLPEPGIITGKELSKFNPEHTVEWKIDPEKYQNLIKKENLVGLELKSVSYWGHLSRQIAKIAHGYVVATLGEEGYKPILPEFILGKNEYISHYVGGLSEEEKNEIHGPLAIKIVVINEKMYIVVYMHFLFAGDLPEYKAVAGLVTDLGAVISNANKQKYA